MFWQRLPLGLAIAHAPGDFQDALVDDQRLCKSLHLGCGIAPAG